jgi:hypothetical protein
MLPGVLRGGGEVRNTAIIIAVCMLLAAVAAQAQTRTTPVEVVNLIGIDPAANTVKAQQSGLWSIGIQGTLDARLVESPTVKFDTTSNTVKAQQTGTWNVGISGTPSVAQSGSWNVGISGTPNMNVSNIPTVRIHGADNVVSTPTRSAAIRLWTENQELATSTSLFGPHIDTRGYREMRVVLSSPVQSTSLVVQIWAGVPDTPNTRLLAYADFGAGAESLSTQANFRPAGGQSMFTIPVIADKMIIAIRNLTGSTVTIHGGSCWVYLVN